MTWTAQSIWDFAHQQSLNQFAHFYKMGHPWSLFHLFWVISNKHYTHILQQINVKNVHPVSGVGIQTHDLLNISLPLNH